MFSDPWDEYRRRHASNAAPAQPPLPSYPVFASPAPRQTFATMPDGNTGFSRSVFAVVGGSGSGGSEGNSVGQSASGPLQTGAFPFCAGQQGVPPSPAVGTQQYAGAPCMSPIRSAGCEQVPPMPNFPQGLFGQGGPAPTMVPPPTSFGPSTNAGFGPGFGVHPQQSANTGMPFGAAQFSQMLNQPAGQSSQSGGVGSAFEALGKSSPVPVSTSESSQDTLLRALQIAITGEKKHPPTWSGSVDSLRQWLKALALWEMDNHLPKAKWGLRLLQSFSDGSAPRRIAETIDTGVLLSDQGYGAVLSAIMSKYSPYLEAVGPATIDQFFFHGERSRNESFASYIAAKEIAKQEIENHVGEKVPDRIAGRVLMKHAGLTESQRESLAIKHSALLTFEQVATALRPLDRPEALMHKVAGPSSQAPKVYALAEDPVETGNGEENDEEELVADLTDFPDPESDGDGGLAQLYFDPDQEYNEEEAQYIWAYNMAYKDVRKELQSRRKGRQFYKPKGSSKGGVQGKFKGKKGDGGKKSSRNGSGSPEELLARTRCFKCQELGHFSRDCPKRNSDRDGGSTQFFVYQGSSGTTNTIYMALEDNNKPSISVFAGIRTDPHEAIVDTAAEEAVIGSTALQQLTEVLKQRGLKPLKVIGVSGSSCSGIGGSATAAGIWDIPIGIAKTNGLIRVTELADHEGFETPFLLPVSYQELVGAVVDVKRNLMKLDNGRKTALRRLPTKHRAVSVVEFLSPWQLPEALQKELKFEKENPFRADVDPSLISGPKQCPGVAVWLKTDGGEYQFVTQLDGPRHELVHPREVFDDTQRFRLAPSRTTVMFPPTSFSIRDVWTSSNNQRSFDPWHGEVFFETISHEAATKSSAKDAQVGNPRVASKVSNSKFHLTDIHNQVAAEVFALSRSSRERCKLDTSVSLSSSCTSSPPRVLTSQASQLYPSSLGELDEKPDRETTERGRSAGSACGQEAGEESMRGAMEEVGLGDHAGAVGGHAADGLGLHPASASADSSSFRTKELQRDQTCQEQSRPSGHRQSFVSLQDLHKLAHGTFRVCSRRRSSEATGHKGLLLVGLSGLWESLGKSRMAGGSSRESGRTTSFRNIFNHSGCHHRKQSGIPQAAASTKVEDRSSSTFVGRNGSDTSWSAIGRPAIDDSESPRSFEAVPSRPEEESTIPISEKPREDQSQVDSIEVRRPHDVGAGGGKREKQPKYVQWDEANEGEISTKDSQIQSTGGAVRDHVIRRGEEEQEQPWNLQLGRRQLAVRSKSRHNTSTTSTTTFAACLMVSWFLPQEPHRLEWLGDFVSEVTTENEEAKKEFIFLLNSSMKELGCTDYYGKPSILDKQDRIFLTGRIRNFLDHVGEVYSPPRITKEAHKQGLKGSIALDLTTGWDFRIPSHRKQALQLVRDRRPAVLILSPPCKTFSPLQNLSSFKRDPEVVAEEQAEGDMHLDFSMTLAELQDDNGRGFVAEQPLRAKSLKRPRVQALLKRPGVFQITLDQCMFGLRVQKGPMVGELANKPTALLSNIPGLEDYVSRRCSKDHRHGHLIGGTAEAAAIYPPEFVKAMVKGIKQSLGLSYDKSTVVNEKGLQRGRAIGSVLFEYGRETNEVAFLEELASSTATPSQSSSSTAAFPTTAPRPETGDDEVDATVRQQLQNIADKPRIEETLRKVEDFNKVDDDQFSLAPQLRREVHRIHRNLGHPSKEIFIRALKHAGVRPDIIDWSRHYFKCPICDARAKPSPARPGHLAKAMEFNTVLGIDLIFVEVFEETITMLNCLCWGTNYQQVAPCANKTSQEVMNVFWNEWIKHFGPPQLLVMDRGKEFYSNLFQESIGGLGTALHFTDPESPWQNSRTERAGGVFKEKLKATLQATSATRDELPVVIAEVVSSRNRFMDRFGFSPMQRVFGKTLRLPSSLLSTDVLDRELVEASAPDAIRRTWDIRDIANQEWMKRQDKEAVQRAGRARMRTTDVKPLHAGQWIYVYRDNRSYRGWVGPGVLIAEASGNGSWWVSMRGRLWRASREQLRPATPEEELGAELVLELSKEMLEKLAHPGQIAYQDITQEEAPGEETDEELLRLFRISEVPPGEQPPEEPTSTESVAESTDRNSTEAPGDETMESTMDMESRRTSVVEGQSRRVSVAESSPPMDTMLPVPESEPLDTERVAIRVDEGRHEPLVIRRPTATNNRPGPYPFVEAPPSLPSPPGRSYYMEVINFDRSEDLSVMKVAGPFIGATWKYSREQQGQVLQPHPHYTGTFDRTEAEASFSLRDKCMYVTKAKTSFGQVEFKHLQAAEKELFRQARKKEMDSLVANGAVKILSIEESEEFRRQFPKQVIESRFVDRYKPKVIDKQTLEHYKKKAIQDGHLDSVPLEQDHTSPKSRWCVVGWLDPDVHEVERSSPTPLSSSLYCCLQLAASRKWKTRIKDVKTAFLQSLPTTRSRKLACRQPHDELLPGLDPRQLLLLLTEVYGLVSGPSWWRRSLLSVATGTLGYKLNEYDKCVLTLPSSNTAPAAKTEGFMVIEVDDIAEGGGPQHEEKMKQLEKMLKFGKIDDLYGNSDGTTYAGRHIRQCKDFSFEHHMDEYIYTRLEPVRLSRRVLKKDAQQIKLDEKEQTQFRGLIASLNWTAREGRPDAAAAASILAATFPEPTIANVMSGNDVVRHLKLFPIKLQIHAIPEEKLRNLLISDAAFDTSGKEKSQHGWLLGFTNELMNQGQKAPVSLMQWRSKRLRRKAASSMLCESISLSAASGALERQDAFMDSI